MSIFHTRGRQFLAIGLATVSLTLGGCAAPDALLDAGAAAPFAPHVAAVPGTTTSQPPLYPSSDSTLSTPHETLLNTGETVPCLDQFVEMMVDWGYATEEELSTLSRAELERLVIHQTKQAGITIEQLCSTLVFGFNDNVLEA